MWTGSGATPGPDPSWPTHVAPGSGPRGASDDPTGLVLPHTKEKHPQRTFSSPVLFYCFVFCSFFFVFWGILVFLLGCGFRVFGRPAPPPSHPHRRERRVNRTTENNNSTISVLRRTNFSVSTVEERRGSLLSVEENGEPGKQSPVPRRPTPTVVRTGKGGDVGRYPRRR